MKIIITESQYEKLLKELPNFLKRRLTQEDFNWFDRNIIIYMNMARVLSGNEQLTFEEFCIDVVGGMLYDFVLDRKNDEILATYNLEYDDYVYDEENARNIVSLYGKLDTMLIEKYKDILKSNWQFKIKKLNPPRVTKK
jgi:hypothetical protein